MKTREIIRLILLQLLIIQKLSATTDQPNLLIMISDDQSFPHASAYGSKMVSTPNFDKVASMGALFMNAFCAAPGCSPSRAAFLTGRNIWQIEEAGTHASSFSAKYETFMESLAEKGYHTGFTGKGWGPGNWKISNRKENPAGPTFGSKKGNYAQAFRNFINVKPKEKPFAFWFGSSDPHRSFEKGSGLNSGKKLNDAEVPSFLPESPEIRNDLLDYAFEIERFDNDCGKMLTILEKEKMLDNTMIIITSDNGMAFPYAKANCTEFGIHMPLAICWKNKIPAKQQVDDLVGFIDLTATIHDAFEIKDRERFPLSGQSILSILTKSSKSKNSNRINAIFSGRERHSSSRFNTLGYPQRCLRTDKFLFVRNYKPERWPAGPGQKYKNRSGSELGPEHGGYHDIDACPTLDYLIKGRSDPKNSKYFLLATDKRPYEQLFDIINDPGCTNDLATNSKYKKTFKKLSLELTNYLIKTSDPRETGNGNVFETYPRYSGIRWFPKPDWVENDPRKTPPTPWLKSTLKIKK